MILEGNLLIGILIVMALAMAVLLVYIRFAVKKEPAETPSMFSRLLKFGSKDEEEEEEEAGQLEAAISEGLSLPKPGSRRKEEAKPEPAEEKTAGLSIAGMFTGLFARKSKDQIKDEVRSIDNQLSNVLKETEEINVTGLKPEIGGTDLDITDGRGMRELDLEMGVINDPSTTIKQEIDLMPMPEPEITLAPPVREPPKEEELSLAQTEQRKPDAPLAPVEADPMKKPAAADPMKPPEPEPMQMQMPGDVVGKKEIGDDLLSSLEATARQEEYIDMTIMKEYQDMPITCVELESELKGILDQITINMHGKKNQEA